MQLAAMGRYGLSRIEPSHDSFNTLGKPRAVLIGLGLRPRPTNTALGSHGCLSGLMPS